MAPRPGNRQRATLSKQALVSQTESVPTAVTFDLGVLSYLHLSIPVHGDPTGLRVAVFDQFVLISEVPGELIDPQTIRYNTGQTEWLAWVIASGALRTASNGKISSLPARSPLP